MKKGFTLIELLAVIVILAIIAVIAVPIVLNIIDESKNNATLRSADFYLNAVEYTVADRMLDNKAVANGTYSILENGNICLKYTDNTCTDEMKVEVNGEKPSNGTITIENGKIKQVSLIFNTQTIVKNDKGQIVFEELTFAESILKSYGGLSQIKENSSFTTTTADGEYGLYKAEDDYGTSYYFRGDVENNYVKFGTWNETVVSELYYPVDYYYQDGFETYEMCIAPIQQGAPWTDCAQITYANENDPMYWRIVRINGDGTIRLVYDGVEKVKNGTKHKATIAKSKFEDDFYSGYSHNGRADSTIKSIVDQWYKDNLEEHYNSYIEDTIFCSDGEVTKYEYYSDFTPVETEEEANVINEYYGAYSRLIENKTPSLKCERNIDRYTINEEKGNGYLTNPVGLITADEVAMAGSVYNSSGSSSYYLYSGERYWTFSPSDYLDGPDIYDAFGDSGTGAISRDVTVTVMEVRPVINLKADVRFTGTGTIEDPYVIITE